MSQAQMTFGDIKLNPSVPRSDRLRLKKQAKAIYNRLITGPVWTSELIQYAKQYNARLREIREALKEFSLTIDIVATRPNGDNRYKIKPLYGSKYQAKQMKKQKRRIS